MRLGIVKLWLELRASTALRAHFLRNSYFGTPTRQGATPNVIQTYILMCTSQALSWICRNQKPHFVTVAVVPGFVQKDLFTPGFKASGKDYKATQANSHLTSTRAMVRVYLSAPWNSLGCSAKTEQACGTIDQLSTQVLTVRAKPSAIILNVGNHCWKSQDYFAFKPASLRRLDRSFTGSSSVTMLSRWQ